MSSLLLSSCTVDDSGGGNGDAGGGGNTDAPAPDYNNDDITFDVGEVVSIVISGEHTEAVEILKSELFYALGKTPKIVADGGSSGKNELFVGNCDNALSKRAYDMLERTEKESEYDARITVYSNGKSVALAYDIPKTAADYDFASLVLSEAIDIFTEKYVNDNSAVNFKQGFCETFVFDVLADIEATDDARIESVWAKIEKNADADTVKELRAMYEMFSPEVLEWLADLYDPESGGFYYSNSARNNEGFLPDIETTAQAIDLLRLSGCFDEYGKNPSKALPEWFKAKLIAFVKGLQDPNGYFYHPQWTHEMVDNRVSRRSRDLTKGLDLLTSLGAKPTYNTPNGVEGDGILADGTPVGFDKPVSLLTTPIRSVSVASAVSKVVPTSTAVPSNLASKEAFVSYLSGLHLQYDSYTIGNDIASQSQEIKARDEYLASIGADYRLKDILKDWLWENCYETTGHWQPVANYDGLNGFMKISAACSALEIPLKYPEAAVRSAINAITTEEYNETVCYAYNAWFSLNNIINILNKCHSVAEADTIITNIRAELKEKAPELIKATAEKQSIFLREGGSFSYTEKSTSSTSQGMPVAVPGTLEGDVNATIICLSDTCNQMFAALGFEMPSIFGTADLFRFLDRVASLSPVIKTPEEIVVASASFDDEKLGEQTQSLKISNGSTSTFKVIEDPREGASKNGKVLEFDSKADGGKRVRLEMDLSANPNSRCWVFEGEFNFASAPNYEFATLMVGPNSYNICFVASDGVVYLQERSSDSRVTSISRDLKTGIPVGEWFKIKVEFFYSTIPDDVRIKLYINDELISVSDNYFDRYGEKLEGGKPSPDARFEGADFFVYSYCEARILMDNLSCYRTKTQYEPITDPNNQPLFNVDGPDRDEIVYDLESDTEGALPESFSVTGAAVTAKNEENKLLSVNGAATVTLPVNIRTAGANATSVELDVTPIGESVGKIFTLTFTEDSNIPHDILKYNGEITEQNGKKYLVIYAAPNGTNDLMIDGVMIPVGESHKLRIEYYDTVRIALFYLDGKLIASSDKLCQNAKNYIVGRVILTTTSAAKLSLDNLVCEKSKQDFEAALKPSVDSFVHDFNAGFGQVEHEGGAVLDGTGDKFVSLSGDGRLVFPVNVRSVITNLITFKASIKIDGALNDSASYRLTFVDDDGNKLISYDIRLKNGVASIHEVTEVGAYSDALCTIKKGTEFTLSFLFYPNRDTAYVLSDNQAIAMSSICYSNANKFIVPTRLIVESAGGTGTLTLDDVVAEASNDTFVPRDVADDKNPEDAATKLTFEGSSTGNLPALVTYKLASADSSIAIRELMKKSSASKVIEFVTLPGKQDSITFGLNEAVDGYNVTVFEAEFKFTFKQGHVTSFQFYLENGEDMAYIVNLAQSGNNLVFCDLSSLGADRVRGGDLTIKGAEEWHTLRVEYYNGTRDSVRIKTYIDGALARVTDNFVGKENSAKTPMSLITSVTFMSYGDTSATLAMDNVSLLQTNKVCADDPLKDDYGSTTPPVTPDEPEYITNPPYSFEDGTAGDVTSSKNDAYSNISVVNDPKNSANKVLKFYKANTTPENDTYTKSWPVVTIPRTVTAKNHNATVFEADLYIEYIEGRLDTTYTFQLGPKSAPAYSFRMNFGAKRFNFIDSSNDTAGISSPSIATASTTGQWFNLRIEFFEGDQNTAKIMVYMDDALIYVSRNFYGPMTTDAAGKKYTVNNDISEVRISTWGDTQMVMLIDNAALYETTLNYPTNPTGAPSGKVYPDAETEDFDAKVLPVKGGANGIITLNTDISADKTTINVLDRVISKYDLKADIAVVVDNLMIGAGVGTNTEEKTPDADMISFLNGKLSGGRLKLMNHGLTHVFWADTETGENIDWDFFYREFIGSKYLLRELFPSQKIKTFVIPGYAWIVDMFGEQIYDEVYETLKEEYVASRYYDGTAANLYDWDWEKTPAHQILPDNDAQTYAVIDSVARGEGRFANLFLYHLDEDKNFDNGTTNGGSETYFYQRESRLDAICKRISGYVETGAIWQTNYEDAMLYLREAESAELTITRGENITLLLDDGLDDDIYDYPLTVRVQLDESYKAVKVTQGDKVSYAIVRAQNGIYFADCDVVPNGEAAVVVSVSLDEIPEDMLPEVPETNDGSVDLGGNNKDDDAWTGIN